MTLLTLAETAERLGCSLSTLRTLDLPPWVIVPGTCQGCGAIVYWSGLRWCDRSGDRHRCARRAAA